MPNFEKRKKLSEKNKKGIKKSKKENNKFI